MKLSNLKNILIALTVVLFASATLLPQTVGATGKADDDACGSSFLGFPTWYRGIVDKTDEGCVIVSPDAGTAGLSNYIWHIILNVIEMAMKLVGYLTVIFIIYGGVLYITSAGDAKGVEKAKSSITNAVIGLVISIVAVAVVEFIFSRLGAA